jgi:hypothetical protein
MPNCSRREDAEPAVRHLGVPAADVGVNRPGKEFVAEEQEEDRDEGDGRDEARQRQRHPVVQERQIAMVRMTQAVAPKLALSFP